MFDELNVLNGKEVIPIERFFREIGMPKNQERERVDLARDIESAMIYVFAYMAAGGDNPARVLADKYREAVSKYMEVDITIDTYIRWMSEMLVKSDDTSDERATLIGENESHTIWNGKEYSDAVDDGMTMKVWHTMRDKRVRGTHRLVEGAEVPIDEPFRVGDSLLMYPRDYSLGASADEIVNCRCWATYR